MSRHVVFLIALAACNPEVNVGADYSLKETKECQEVTALTAECPTTPWGAQVSIDSVASLEQRLVGKWAFCGGELRYSGRGPLRGLAHGAGIEFWSESGTLRYAFLRGTKPVLLRNESAAANGTVRLLVENGRGRAVLSADDGQQAVWNADFFDGERVLQNGAFDVWNFVAIE